LQYESAIKDAFKDYWWSFFQTIVTLPRQIAILKLDKAAGGLMKICMLNRELHNVEKNALGKELSYILHTGKRLPEQR
jgi:hypothetical protein